MYQAKIFKSLKNNNPDKYPSSLGEKWTPEEEEQLLIELSKNINFEEIANNHNRTVGGIKSRIKYIALNMLVNNVPIEEIIVKTKLDEEIIKQLEVKKDYKKETKNSNILSYDSLNNDIIEIKNQLVTINTNIQKIFNLLQTLEIE